MVACATANPDNLPGFFGLQQQIKSYYEYNAWEGNATCLAPRLLGVTRANIVSETADQMILNVDYAWRDNRNGGSHGRNNQNQSSGAGSCSGFSERQFVVAKCEGGGYSVVSMSGPQRD